MTASRLFLPKIQHHDHTLTATPPSHHRGQCSSSASDVTLKERVLTTGGNRPVKSSPTTHGPQTGLTCRGRGRRGRQGRGCGCSTLSGSTWFSCSPPELLLLVTCRPEVTFTLLTSRPDGVATTGDSRLLPVWSAHLGGRSRSPRQV